MLQTAKISALIIGSTFSLFLLMHVKPASQELRSHSTQTIQQTLLPIFIQIESPLLLPTVTPTIEASLVQSTTIPEVAPEDEWKLNLFPWQGIETQSQGNLIQISNTPFGIDQVKWSPRFYQLWIDAVTAFDQQGHIYQTTGLLTGKYTNSWPIRGNSSDQCETSAEWFNHGQSLLFLRDDKLWRSIYRGTDQQEVDLSEYADRVLSIDSSPDGSLATILVESDKSASPQFDLLLLDAKTNSILSVIENVGLGSIRWSTDNKMLAYWGRVNRTEHSAFGAIRLSIFTVSTNTVIQKDLATLVSADQCPPKPSWLENDSHLLLYASTATGPIITDIEGNSIPFQKHLLNLFRAGISKGDLIPQMADTCTKVVASPNGQFLLLSPNDHQIMAVDLINKAITNQIDGFLCDGNTHIVWNANNRFLKWGLNQALVFVDPIQPGSTFIDTDGVFPAWSAALRIAYWKKSDNLYSLWMFDFRNGKPQQLSTVTWQSPFDNGAPFAIDMTPKWSPNGRSIAFVASRNYKSEAFLIENLSAESENYWLPCERNGQFYHCVDEQIGIELDVPLRYGKLSASLSGGMCGGFAYSYNYNFGGGLSWDFCQPMDGGQYNFHGFSAPQDKEVWTTDPCSYIGDLAACEILPNGVMFAIRIPGIDAVCSDPAPGLIRGTEAIIAIDLPETRIVQGYMFSFSFLSTQAEDQLLGPFVPFPPEANDCSNSELRQAYQTAAEELQVRLKTNSVDEETAYKLKQIQHMAESIVIH